MLDVEFEPLTGSPAALADAAAGASRTAARLTDARGQLLRVHAALAGQRGGAVAEAQARVTGLADDTRAGAGMLDAAAVTLRRHADALGEARAAAERAIADRADALARERTWQAEADEARRSTWNAASPGVAAPLGTAAGLGTITLGASSLGTASLGTASLDPGAAHARLLTAERELAAARADAAAAEARWRAARDAKADASRRATAAVRALADVRAVRAAVAAGMSGAQLQASAAEGRHAAALLRVAAGGAEPGRRAALTELFAARSDDPAFWAAFWDTATPEQLYLGLVPAVDGPFDPLDPRLADALGHGVEEWARSANPEELRHFGHGVVDGVGGAPWGQAGRAQVAAALLPADLPAAAHAGAGDTLDARWEEFRLDDGSLTAMAPVVVAVAGGYAAHRRLAFDRLAPTDEARVAQSAERWLGTSPRGGWPDGGRAIARAFGTAVEVGSTSADRGEQARAALLVSHATPVLPDGLLASPGLADDAASDVARTYEPYLPSMGDAVRGQSLSTGCDIVEPPPPAGTDHMAEMAKGVGDRIPVVVQPELDAFALRDVIGATSRTPGAAAVWLGATDRYVEATVENATSGAFDAIPVVRASLVLETLSDVGAVAGGMQAETIESAKDQVATREALVGLAGEAVGVVRVGGPAVTGAVSGIGGHALAFLDTGAPLDDAREQVRNAQDELFDRYAPATHEAVVEHDRQLGLPAERVAGRNVLTDPSENGSPPQITFDKTFDDLTDPPEEKCD